MEAISFYGQVPEFNPRLLENVDPGEWEQAMRTSVDDSLLLLKEDWMEQINFSPVSSHGNSQEVDDRDIWELTPSEREFVIGLFFEKIGFNPKDKNQEPVRSYTAILTDGTEILMSVYATKMSEQNPKCYLHIPQDRIDCLIAPVDYELGD